MTHFRILSVFLVLLAAGSTSVTSAQMPGAAGPQSGSFAAPTAPALPLYATRHREFAIPFNVDRQTVQPVEQHLYVSVDRGANWTLQARQPPHTQQFVYRAPQDGEYWFATRTIGAGTGAAAQTSPRPELRVMVDTVAPQIEMTVRTTQNGEVLATWQIFDQNLLVSSMKLEYQDVTSQSWKPVPLQLPRDEVLRNSFRSQTSWWPETSSATMIIRAEVHDRAGNLGTTNRRLLLPALLTPHQGTHGPGTDLADSPRPSPGAIPWPSEPSPGMQNNALTYGPTNATRSRHVAPPAAAASLPQAPTYPGPIAATGAGMLRPDHSVTAQPASTQPAPPLTNLPAANQSGASPAVAPAVATPPRNTPTNATDAVTLGPSAPPSAPPAHSARVADNRWTDPAARGDSPADRDAESLLPAGERPQMARSPRFQLEYDVHAVGPAGVAEVQLWATADGGRTWRMWGTDDDLVSPFDVAVEEEGIFGFHVVVVGKNGMSGRRPRTGDVADIWVGVDTTPPEAKLQSATYGEGGETGKLLIQWQAQDRFLDERPITLSFSESAEGPWTTIVSALPNSGRFAWPADPQLPPAVYLKLDVRDKAGNVSSVQTDTPIGIDGLAPKARIRGVQTLHDLDREAFRVPRRR